MRGCVDKAATDLVLHDPDSVQERRHLGDVVAAGWM